MTVPRAAWRVPSTAIRSNRTRHAAPRHAPLFAIIAAFLVSTACARQVTRDDWHRMSPNEKTLYVQSLIGGETARERKGGEGREIRATPAEIVQAIDAAYAKGDARSAEEIFSTLALRRQPPRRPASP